MWIWGQGSFYQVTEWMVKDSSAEVHSGNKPELGLATGPTSPDCPKGELT